MKQRALRIIGTMNQRILWKHLSLIFFLQKVICLLHRKGTPNVKGPTQSIGIQSVQIFRRKTPLDNEFAAFSGKQLRSRLFTLDPDAVIGLHVHQRRSGICLCCFWRDY